MFLRDYKWLGLLLAVACLCVLAQTVATADEPIEGKIKSMALAPDYQVVVTDKAGKEWTFPLDDGTKVRVNGKEGRLADLKAGDVVFVTNMGEDKLFLATEIRCIRK